jgi:hypothetical protein
MGDQVNKDKEKLLGNLVFPLKLKELAAASLLLMDAW